MSAAEKVYHREQDIEYYTDNLSQAKTRKLKTELKEMLRYHQDELDKERLERAEELQNSFKKISVQSLLNETTIVPMITGRFTVPLFIRGIVGCLKPFFGAIISLALLTYGLDNISLIIESYKHVASLLGEELILSISILF